MPCQELLEQWTHQRYFSYTSFVLSTEYSVESLILIAVAFENNVGLDEHTLKWNMKSQKVIINVHS